jgi:NADH:ubiquinone oxidoreductase subunit H
MKDVLALIGCFVAVVVVVVGSLIGTLTINSRDQYLAWDHPLNMWGFTIFMVALFGGNTFKGDND